MSHYEVNINPFVAQVHDHELWSCCDYLGVSWFHSRGRILLDSRDYCVEPEFRVFCCLALWIWNYPVIVTNLGCAPFFGAALLTPSYEQSLFFKAFCKHVCFPYKCRHTIIISVLCYNSNVVRCLRKRDVSLDLRFLILRAEIACENMHAWHFGKWKTATHSQDLGANRTVSWCTDPTTETNCIQFLGR